ncbi:MAG TPA: 23S rRNA (guanosine(2251)-2'-O)-methyltransferase RlmB, partial [Acidimicrobiales bacterium]|nr:23S rRNA (guanosine(2251)-2'-O)-methyltransferase RlmB [Acidimicrobiales bacterium]
VEGHHAVHHLLSAARRPVHRIWVAEGRLATGPLEEIAALARRHGVAVDRKDKEALLAASLTGAPQGVIAWAAPVRAISLDALLETAQPEPFLLVLDGVTDPGNFGALLRTAACAGAGGVVIGRHRSAPLTAAAVKSAAGAVELVPIAQVPGVPAALSQLPRAGVWVVGLHPDAEEDLWQSRSLDGPVALVLGAEGSGLSRLARQRCDALVRVPQSLTLGSLNVSAAAAVACFEVSRRRMGLAGPAGRASGPPL